MATPTCKECGEELVGFMYKDKCVNPNCSRNPNSKKAKDARKERKKFGTQVRRPSDDPRSGIW